MGFPVLFFLGLLLGLFITLIFEFVLKKNKKLRYRYYHRHEILLGYHVHHSTYGLVVIVISMAYLSMHQITTAVFLFGVGVGIITMHTLSDGRFIFIEKQKRK